MREPIRAAGLISVITVVAGALAFLAQVFMARGWSTADYGRFVTALASVNLVAPLAGFGLGAYWLQAFGVEGWAGRRWLRVSLWYVGLTAILALLMLSAWAAMGRDGVMRHLMIVLSPTALLLLLVQITQSRFQLEHRFGAVSRLQLAPVLPRCAAALAAVAGLSVSTGGLVYLAGTMAMTAALLPSAAGMFRGRLDLAGHGPRHGSAIETSPPLRRLLAEAWPFGTAGLLYLVLYQSDLVMVGWMRDPQEAGLYGVAYTIIAAACLIPNAIYQKLLRGLMHRYAVHEPDRFLAVFRFGSPAMLLLGVAAGGITTLFGLTALTSLFGQDYRPAVLLLVVLSLSLPIRFLAASVGGALLAGRQVRIRVQIQALAAVLNVGLNFWLIPRYGALAAAWTTVVCEAVQLGLFGAAVQKHVFGAAAWRAWTLHPGRALGAVS